MLNMNFCRFHYCTATVKLNSLSYVNLYRLLHKHNTQAITECNQNSQKKQRKAVKV